MRRAALTPCLGCATAAALAWLLAATVPVPMYPRRVARDWLGDDGRAWSTSEVRPVGVHDIWWGDLAGSFPGTAEDALAAARDSHAELEAARRGTKEHLTALHGPPSWGTLARARAGPPNVIGSDTAYGFPIPCLWFSVRADMEGNSLANERLRGGVPVAGEPSARGRDFRALPLLPRWPALLVDAAFWMGVWWVLLTVPSALRRRARRRRGRCPGCGYDLAGLDAPACPECGVGGENGAGVAQAAVAQSSG